MESYTAKGRCTNNDKLFSVTARYANFLIIFIGILLNGCDRNNGSFICHFGVPGRDQYALVDTVAKHIEKNYADFADRISADRTHQGKIYYWAPACVPYLEFYEIVEPSDIATIERLARQSLDIAGIERVHLIFYEKQNWVTFSANGGGHRGHEKVIKDITVTKVK